MNLNLQNAKDFLDKYRNDILFFVIGIILFTAISFLFISSIRFVIDSVVLALSVNDNKSDTIKFDINGLNSIMPYINQKDISINKSSKISSSSENSNINTNTTGTQSVTTSTGNIE